VYLNPAGRSLLALRGHFSAGVRVTSVGRTLRLDTVTVTRPGKRRH
jgi:hypothetical protein